MAIFCEIDDKHIPLYRVVWVASTPHFCGEDDCNREGFYEIRLEQGDAVWAKREERFQKKFTMGRRYIYTEVFPWLDASTPLEQVAILITGSRPALAGGRVISIDQFMKEVKNAVITGIY